MEQGVSARFETIVQMLLEQKRLMEALEAENHELRRQLDELKHGVGISIVIHEHSFQLTGAQKIDRPPQNISSPEKQEAYKQQGGKREGHASHSSLADSFVL